MQMKECMKKNELERVEVNYFESFEMRLFCWDDSYSCDLVEVDYQHKKLINIINNCAVCYKEGGFDYKTAIHELIAYTKEHFETEELIMKETGISYEFYSKHVLEHKKFIHQVNSFKNGGGGEAYMLDFLVAWFAYHILGMDKDMSYQIKLIQSGYSPDDAYSQLEQDVFKGRDPLIKSLARLFNILVNVNISLRDFNLKLEAEVMEKTRELKEKNKKLEMYSFTDPLTGLMNRRFIERYFKDCPNLIGFSMLMIDLDGFKIINDNLGHHYGDLYLKKIAISLKDSCRNSDLVCRLGGDEFLIICPDTSLAGVTILSRKLLLELERIVVVVDGHEYRAKASIGGCIYNESMKSYLDLIHCADKKCYQAKRLGGNQLHI